MKQYGEAEVRTHTFFELGRSTSHHCR